MGDETAPISDGFGSWSDTAIDEAVREVKSEMDDDFERETYR